MKIINRFICAALSIILFSETSRANLPYIFSNERRQIPLETYGKEIQNFSDDEKYFFESLLSEPLQETADLMLLLETLEAKTELLQSETENLETRILNSNTKNEVIVELENIGTAKYAVLGYGEGARIFVQIYIYKSNTIYNLVDLNVLNPRQWDGAIIKEMPKIVEALPSERMVSVVRKDGEQEILPLSEFRVKRRYLKIWKASLEQKTAQLLTRTQKQEMTQDSSFVSNDGSPEGTEAFIKSMIDEAKLRKGIIKHDHHHTRAEYGIHVVNLFHNGSEIVQKDTYDHNVENKGLRSYINYVKSIKEGIHADWEHWDQNRSLKTFQTGDFRTTWRSIFFQELLTIPLAQILTPEHAYVGPLLTLTWGVVVGFYNKIYRNAQAYARTPAEKNIVTYLVSISYNYAFGILVFGISSLDPTTLSGLTKNLFLWINVWISSWAKIKFQSIPISRERARLVPKQLNIFGFKIGWGPSDEAQTASNITSAFKFIDLADKTVLFGPAELKFTIGKLIFIASGFMAHLAAMWYTNLHNLPEKKLLREEWMRYHSLRKPFLSKEDFKNMSHIDDIILKYPGTQNRILIPFIGMAQDILESILTKTFYLFKNTPRLFSSISEKHTRTEAPTSIQSIQQLQATTALCQSYFIK